MSSLLLASFGCGDRAQQQITPLEGTCSVAHCGPDHACDEFTPTREIVDGSTIDRHGAPPNVPLPDVPLITRRVRLGLDPPPMGQDGHYLSPVVPAWRTSSDGRLALIRGGIQPVLAELKTFQDAPISRQDPSLGESIFGDASRGHALPPGFGDTTTGGLLCTPDTAGPQPHDCPYFPGQDCYDLVVITRNNDTEEMWSAPIHVRVSSPKTAMATVEGVSMGDVTKVKQPFHSAGEMLTTRDGHLAIMRIHNGGDDGGGQTLSYHVSTGKMTRPISVVYSYADEACNIRQWLKTDADGTLSSIRPLPAAFKDDRLKDANGKVRYGFAARQMRDAENTLLDETDVLPGSYPWLDREGNNVIMSTVDPRPVSSGKVPYARFPMESENHDLAYVATAPRGFAIIGAWTQGKEVVLDDMLNNDDYGFDPSDTHRVAVYQANGKAMAVRVNGGSNNGMGKLNIPFADGNNDEVESFENVFNMHRDSLPVTPRDVVWTITRGLASDEVAFDDFTDPELVLFAPMNASQTPIGSQDSTDPRNEKQLDGFPGDTDIKFTYDATKVRLQNAATTPLYTIADPGKLDADGRIEPFALGGVTGRGLWLDDGDTASFHFPADARRDKAFFVSVFVDARDTLVGTSPVFTFRPPNGPSWSLSLASHGSAAVIDDGLDQHTIDISCQVGSWKLRWHHLGVLFEGAKATLYVDGNPLAPVALSIAPSIAGEGTFVIGGVRGWYDEARVALDGEGHPFKTRPAPELLCNVAHGTMVQDSAGTRCATDYTRDLGVGRGVLPPGAKSLRDSILTGDAPLYWDQPRPESTARPFCLTCHVDVADDPSRPVGLTYEALTAGQVPAYQDRRAQPMQPPSIGPDGVQVLGNIPPGWVEAADGKRYPVHAQQGPKPLLPWVLPKSPQQSLMQ